MNRPSLAEIAEITEDGLTPNRPPDPGRLMLENSGCYATKDDEAIRVFSKEGAELYGLSPKVIPYESKALFLTLQIYFMGYNNGRAVGLAEARNKLTELIKLCL